MIKHKDEDKILHYATCSASTLSLYAADLIELLSYQHSSMIHKINTEPTSETVGAGLSMDEF